MTDSSATVKTSDIETTATRRESVHSPQCWGFESPSLLNREVSNILSRGNPPAEDERHKWTHPSPVQQNPQNLQNLQAQQAHHPPHTSSRPLSCPLYHTTQPVSNSSGSGRKFVSQSPVTVSPFQLPDQSQELRNHLYQAAYQHHSPFRFPFLPVNRYLQSLPQSPLRLPYPFPYPYPPPYPGPEACSNGSQSRESPLSHKRKHEDSHGSVVKAGNTRISPILTGSSSRSGQNISSSNSTSPFFRAGSLIQLANGNMKKVEDLTTDDFMKSAATCPDISIDQALVTKLELQSESSLYTITFSVGQGQAHAQFVSVTVTPDHPFFVTSQGWSSCSPTMSLTNYKLSCSQLSEGDICISLRYNQPDTTSETKQKQVRFLDSPVPLKKKRNSNSSPESANSDSGSPSSVRFNMKVSGMTLNSEHSKIHSAASVSEQTSRQINVKI